MHSIPYAMNACGDPLQAVIFQYPLRLGCDWLQPNHPAVTPLLRQSFLLETYPFEILSSEYFHHKNVEQRSQPILLNHTQTSQERQSYPERLMVFAMLSSCQPERARVDYPGWKCLIQLPPGDGPMHSNVLQKRIFCQRL